MAKINMQKIEEFLWKIHALYKSLEPYKEFYEKVTQPVETIFSSYEKAIKGDIVKSENDDINKLWAIGKVWKNELDKISRKDENFWMTSSSGLQFFDKKSYTTAFNTLRDIKNSLKDLRSGADGLAMLIISISVNDHLDIVSALQGLQTTKALDIEARRRSRKEFTDCMEMIDKIMPPISNSMEFLHRNAI